MAIRRRANELLLVSGIVLIAANLFVSYRNTRQDLALTADLGIKNESYDYENPPRCRKKIEEAIR